MWDIKKKKNKINGKNKHVNTENRTVVSSGKGSGGWAKQVTGINW